MTDIFEAQENQSEAAVQNSVFPISTYAYRIKRRAAPELRNSEFAKIMVDILAKKKIFSRKADDAVLKALDAAANHQLAKLRFEDRQSLARHANELLDDLISSLQEFVDAISNLPPNSKGTLNARMADEAKGGIFDTEIFIEWINCIAACLPQLSPRRLAYDAFLLLGSDVSSEQAPLIVRLWEAIPSVTRNQVECEVEGKLLKRSGVEMLRLLPELLRQFQPPSRQGAPLSLHLTFVSEIDSIWLGLGLRGRRSYDGYAKKGKHHIQSAFQTFCNAALAAVGDDSQISHRQIANLKKRAKSNKGKPTH
jgi:hypothetical protein